MLGRHLPRRDTAIAAATATTVGSFGMSTLPLWSVVSPARLDKAQNYRCATGRPMRLPTAPAYPRLYQGGWFKTPGTNTTPT